MFCLSLTIPPLHNNHHHLAVATASTTTNLRFFLLLLFFSLDGSQKPARAHQRDKRATIFKRLGPRSWLRSSPLDIDTFVMRWWYYLLTDSTYYSNEAVMSSWVGPTPLKVIIFSLTQWSCFFFGPKLADKRERCFQDGCYYSLSWGLTIWLLAAALNRRNSSNHCNLTQH